VSWRAAPVAIAAAIALTPTPDGLAPHAWYYFAIFAGVIVALMLEPLPGAAIGVIGVTLATVLSPWVLYSPAELGKAGFNPANSALGWALSGFANSTVWLIFAAFMFALGYDRTGLGRRISLVLVKAMGRRTLTLGYAVTFADVVLSPFTPSNTARSGGTIFPVIKNLPPLPVAAGRSVGAAHRQLSDVDGDRRHLHHSRCSSPRWRRTYSRWVCAQDRQGRHLVDAVVRRLRAGRHR
jgi:L-tartrate/succinate antiporter